ncbi:hypothetical protein FRC06_003880 [Ceratobasidium sp. 370]|nr:hypothetical protein FRC06_003880 [Ceratobasidium sp. 370]
MSEIGMAANLRLPDFIPGLLVPPEGNLVLTVGTYFLIFALCTLTITSHPRTLALVRIVLSAPATYAFWVYAFQPFIAPRRSVDTGLAVVGMYGIMLAVDTCLVDLVVGVHSPQLWIIDGKVAPLPTTFLGRLGYAVDCLFSLRGTIMFKNTTWDWLVPSTKRRLPSPSTPRIYPPSWSLFKQYILLDMLDVLSKFRI